MSDAKEASSPGPRHFIVTLFGLYAREQGGILAVADLIRMLSELGFDGAAVRSSISRLKRSGVLESVKVGSVAGYRRAPRLEGMFRSGDERILHPHRASAKDPWVLASFSVPERDRHLRHRLRSILTALGFGQVTPGLWIAPATITEELRDAIARAGLSEYVELFEANHLTSEHANATVGRWWDLEALDSLYIQFIRRFEPVLKGWQDNPNQSDANAFRDYITVLTAWRRFPYLDPGLPLEYLPKNWSGVAAETLFTTLRNKLDTAARRFAQLD